MKRCSRCLEVKPLSEFGIRNRLVKGERVKQYLSYCKKCNSEYSSKRYREMKSNNLKCIYRFLDIDNNVIYIGKTERLRYRMNQHLSNIGHLPKECYEMTKKIQFMSMKSTVLMDMREMYYINLYKPKFNSSLAVSTLPEKQCITAPYTNLLLFSFRIYNVSAVASLLWIEMGSFS